MPCLIDLENTVSTENIAANELELSNSENTQMQLSEHKNQSKLIHSQFNV